jgi:hypothetical protein
VVDSSAAATAPRGDAELGTVDYYGTDDMYAVGTRSASGRSFGLITDRSSGVVVTFYVDGEPQDWKSSESADSGQAVRTMTMAPKFGETISAWGTEMTVSAPELLDMPEQLEDTVATDTQVHVVLVTILNTWTDRSREFKLSWIEGQDQDGLNYDASVQFQAEAIGAQSIAAGETLESYVGFALPMDSRLISVTYDPPYDHQRDPVYVTWEE